MSLLDTEWGTWRIPKKYGTKEDNDLSRYYIISCACT